MGRFKRREGVNHVPIGNNPRQYSAADIRRARRSGLLPSLDPKRLQNAKVLSQIVAFVMNRRQIPGVGGAR